MVPAVVTAQLNRFTPRAVYMVPKSNVAKPISSVAVIQNAVTLGGSATPPAVNNTSAQTDMLGSLPAPVTQGLGNVAKVTGLSNKTIVILGIALLIIGVLFLRK